VRQTLLLTGEPVLARQKLSHDSIGEQTAEEGGNHVYQFVELLKAPLAAAKRDFTVRLKLLRISNSPEAYLKASDIYKS
jgi:hypothetical protein